jgi:hypothetical protein
VSPRSELRPLTTPEALDAALLLLSHAAPRYYLFSSIGVLPAAVLTLVYYHWVGTLLKGHDETYWEGTTIWALAMAAAWIFLSICRGAMTLAALADARGEPLGPEGTLRECWRTSARRWASLALIGSAATAAVWLAGSCLAAGALLPLSAWMVARAAVMDEDRRYAGALQRSADLTRGYRGKACRLWGLFALVWIAASLNLYMGVRGLLGAVTTFFGYDVSAWMEVVSYHNRAYLVWLGVILFLLLDPLKTCADVALYLDLRIRREGADLQTRLRTLSAAAGILALALLAPRPAAATTLEEYRQQVQGLKQQIRTSQTPDQVDPRLRRAFASGTVRMPDGQTVTVDNRWINESADRWGNAGEKEGLVNRLEALDRSLGEEGEGPQGGPQGGREGGPGGTLPAAAKPSPRRAGPDQAYRDAIARPEFQELAERPELRRMMGELEPKNVGTWFEKLGLWIRRYLLRSAEPRMPRISGPNWSLSPGVGRIILYALLALLGGGLLAEVLRALFLRWQERSGPKAMPAAAARLEESETENALEHSADEWETFAAEWLRRGDLRQAVRALYLALLVDLHQQRLIDYNRAFTNWHYVRRFAGDTEQRQVLRRLTEFFDLAWYGRRACSHDQYQEFATGVRALVKATPAGGLAHV